MHPDALFKRAALVCDWFLPRMGGIELHIADLANALARQNLESRVFSTTPGPDTAEGVAVERLPSIKFPLFGFACSPLLVNRLAARLEESQCDIVHAHASVVSPLAFAALIAAGRLKLPVVMTFHSMLFRAARVLRWSDAMFGWSRRPIVYTAVSRVVASQAAAGLPGREIDVLPNAVDFSAWTERPFRPAPPDGKIIVAAAMRLVPKKRPIALLESFQMARKIADAHDRELELRIAGDGPERPKVERMIERSGLSGHVRLLGELSRADVRALHGEADIFVMPSSREAFGIAGLEARASGLPVVAMRGAGAEDFLIDGETGLLAGDDRSLAAHIARLATDDALRRRLSGRDASLAAYNQDAAARRHLDLYARAAALLSA